MRNLRIGSLFLSLILCLCSIIVLLVFADDPAQGQAVTRYVATTGHDSGDCSAPNHPCHTVQYAVDQASNFSDVILVASGVYTGVNSRGGLSQMVYISKDVAIRGGYTPAFAEPRDPETNLTVLDAEGGGRVIYVTGGIAPVVEGFRITGGDATGLGGGLSGRDAGGGIYVTDATATIRANEIVSNTAERGAGLCLTQSPSAVKDNVIDSNVAGEGGGGLDVLLSQAEVSDNVIQNNQAYRGAGIVLHGSAAFVKGNTIAHNRTDWDGAGVFIHQSDGAVLTNNALVGNSANAGGAIYLNFSNAEVAGNTILSNTARHGGGLYLWESDAVLKNNIIAENNATNSGAGLYILGSSPRAFHETLVHNSSGDGTGVYVTNLPEVYSSVSFTNTILAAHGVGFYVQPGNTVTMDATLWGSETWGNGQDWHVESGGNFSSVRDHWLAPGFAGPDVADYHLGPDSAAIDRGVDGGVAVDIDGEARRGIPDLGADEFLVHIYLPMMLRSAL